MEGVGLAEGVGDLDIFKLDDLITGPGEVTREDTVGDTTRGIIEGEVGPLVDRGTDDGDDVELAEDRSATIETGGGEETMAGTGTDLTAGEAGDETGADFTGGRSDGRPKLNGSSSSLLPKFNAGSTGGGDMRFALGGETWICSFSSSSS